MFRDKEVLTLAKYFLQEYRKKRPYCTLNALKKHWKYFEQTVDTFASNPEWNARAFILSLFEERDVFPPMLPTKKSWETFIEYKHRFVYHDNEKNLVSSLLNTYKKIKEWSERNGFNCINYEAFFKDEKNRFFIKRNNFDTYLFTICKSFLQWYNQLEDKSFLPEMKFISQRAMIFQNKKILNKMRQVLEKEFE